MLVKNLIHLILTKRLRSDLDNNEDAKRDIIGLIYMGSSKRQDLLSKLGAWGPWKRVEVQGKAREGSKQKMYSSLKKIN